MQAYASRLSGEDMAAVVDYIRAALMRPEGVEASSGPHARGAPAGEPAAAPLKSDLSLPLPDNLRGNIAAGKKFYDGNCATCHGVKGDGQGPRAYFINPKPRVFINAKARAAFNRPFIFDAVSTGRRGSEMPAWDKVLGPQEIADVSEYVFRAFIQPGTKSASSK